MFNASNTYGFLKCKYGSDSNLSSVASGFFGKQVIQSVRNKIKFDSKVFDTNIKTEIYLDDSKSYWRWWWWWRK